MSLALRSRLAPLGLFLLFGVVTTRLATATLNGMGVDGGYEVRYIPSGRALRLLSPAVKLSIANAYWLATVQYIGDQSLRRGKFEKLFPLIDLVTDLDPKHGYAFQTAGIVLSSAGRLDESDAILKKGIEKGPDWWSYPFYIAFNNFFYRGDYPAAAHWAQIAARTPGASTNISQLALALEVKSGDPQSAVDFLREMHATAKDGATEKALAEQLRLAVLQRDFAQLDAAVARFTAERGRAPRSLEEVRAAGYLARIPDEPFSGRYELREDGKVHSTGRDFRFKPAERGRGIPAAPADTRPPILRRGSTP